MEDGLARQASISPDFGKASSSPVSRTFGAVVSPDETERTILVHFKVLSANNQERLEAARLIMAQLRDTRLASGTLSFLITDESVESSLSDTSAVAARLVSDVKRTLGINDFVGAQ